MKKYNNRRHYETHHVERYRGFQGQPRREKVKELMAGLKKQQPVFTSSRDTSATAVKASYLTTNDIALASKPYSEGEFMKTCILKAAEIMCSEKLQVFANISPTRNTVVERISNIFVNLDSQLRNKVKLFVTFSVALDESTDILDVAQLAIFIRGVDETLSVTVEFLGLVLMTDTTTASGIFNSHWGTEQGGSRLIPCCQYYR